MRHVDEYRDPAAVATVVRRIRETVTRPWTLMEVCGGQTHSILKFGLDELLPAGGAPRPRPGLPGLRHPARDDRPGDRDRLPARHDLLLLRRHAARAGLARRPAQGQGPRRRRADRLLAARRRCAWRGSTPTARSSSSRSASRRPPPPTPWPCTARRPRVSPTSPSSWPTSSSRPPSRRSSSAEGVEIQGLLAPGHVCAVVGYEDYEPVAARYRIPIVVTGFEPLDLLKGVLAARHPARGGRGPGREPVPPRGRPRGQPRRPAHDRGRLRRLRPRLARPRRDPEERLRASRRATRPSTPRGSSTSRACR